MIAAAGVAMSPPMPNSGSGTGGSVGSAAPSASAATAAPAGGSAVAAGNDPASASASASASATAHKPGANTRDARIDFDALLADAGALAPSSALPIPATLPAAAPATTKPTNAPADAPVETALPDQLLALLGGHWALPPATTPTGNLATADAALGASTPSLANAGLGQAGLAPMPPATGLTQATIGQDGVDGALPMPAVTTAEPGAATLPALATLAAGEFGASSAATDTTDSSGLIAELGAAEPPPLPTTSATAALGGARATSAVPNAAIALPADPDAGFDDAFGARIAWLAEQRLGHAEIRITPDHAGPIDVRLQLDGNRVSAEFQSANPEVRQALEASMARLRDMLGQHGMQLAHAGVGNGQSDRHGDPRMSHGHDPAREAELDPRMGTGPTLRSTRGLLDEYA